MSEAEVHKTVLLIFKLDGTPVQAQTKFDLLSSVVVGYGAEVCDDLGALFPKGTVVCKCRGDETCVEILSTLRTMFIRPVRKFVETEIDQV